VSDAITVRPATKADASDIALLVNIATHGGPAQRWATDERAGDAYDPAEVGRLSVLGEEAPFSWRNATMAEADGETVGMLMGYREPDEAQALPGDLPPFLRPIYELEAEAAGCWYIAMLGVHLNWRGKGVGSRLLEVAEEKGAATAARGLALICEDVNAGARRLYARRGFTVRSQRKMVRFPGGGPQGEDWLLMLKD
jgi:ribosomal protein S18 acetylase RimI-like enzyme